VTNLLFVCLGNICRSPAAEGVMTHLLSSKGMVDRFKCDSAGTSAYHIGEPADGRMRQFAMERGFKLTSVSRQFVVDDFRRFDLIFPMDLHNYSDLIDLDAHKEFQKKVVPFTEFCETHIINQVPDPYYGGDAGFEFVMDIIEDGCQGILKYLNKN